MSLAAHSKPCPAPAQAISIDSLERICPFRSISPTLRRRLCRRFVGVGRRRTNAAPAPFFPFSYLRMGGGLSLLHLQQKKIFHHRANSPKSMSLHPRPQARELNVRGPNFAPLRALVRPRPTPTTTPSSPAASCSLSALYAWGQKNSRGRLLHPCYALPSRQLPRRCWRFPLLLPRSGTG